ncbi:methanobactin export MATE transporter MbnM [Enhygromyxa salina]|uniref:Cytochrome c551 peroxidase n=1 Tax=Enhygromyxa salina TaxID=215803 RepID=A0A2S9Y606_9BACT|nr:methanobactin export MATE transporter MbnM [Enhygromyxa salina]PRQ00522.1 Cytochrome c551 peroxidase precursor [Enhygromyxa salina]
MARLVLAGVAAVTLIGGGTGCAPADPPAGTPYVWELPEHLAPPWVPADNPMTVEKVELGRHLFYDPSLSVTGDVSCASCHLQSMAFSDGDATSVGADGERGVRSSMSLANVAYLPTLTWANPVLDTLEAQALVPLFLDVPLEMGAQYVIAERLVGFREDPTYASLFAEAFPAQDDPFTIANVAYALASFERTLISAGSPYDAYLAGDTDALDASATRGLAQFEALGCANCHAGPLQTASFRSEDHDDGAGRFENTGLYNLGDEGAYPLPNTGLYEFTHDPRDLGKHRVPSLRNIAETAPYMHDGSVPDLDAVLDHYAAGGRTIDAGANAGVGADNPNKSELVTGFELSATDRADLIAFLGSLTDPTFLTDPRFANPW